MNRTCGFKQRNIGVQRRRTIRCADVSTVRPPVGPRRVIDAEIDGDPPSCVTVLDRGESGAGVGGYTVLGSGLPVRPNHRNSSSISAMQPPFYPLLKEIDILRVIYGSVGVCGYTVLMLPPPVKIIIK